QLTMRTFHMGGVAEGADITQGLTRVEELFEARPPRSNATLSEIDGKVSIKHKKDLVEVSILEQDIESDDYNIPKNYEVSVKKGDKIKAKQILARSTKDKGTIKAKIDGKVTKVEGHKLIIKHNEEQVRVYNFGHRERLQVTNGQLIGKGTPLSRGHLNLQELLHLTDVHTVQRYIMMEVQHIYASQGQTINDKHIEIIIKQMFSKVRVVHPGDSEFLTGETITVSQLERVNIDLKAAKKQEAIVDPLLLGISRIAIMTESWLSAASFQETIRVLVEASTTKMVDLLKGLKENVIIGKLIPAGEIYKQQYLKDHQK
ncbi:DNA-directed RNA polymerase subunit beta', partial [Candidatus Pacearchaeota archaeon]|nr:DNA-directed RNA polymerase subunit beta' [Candidatus Pacearchaeota archaeon]